VAGGASAGTGVFAIDASSWGAAQLTLASLPTSSAQLVGRGGVVLEDVLSERRPPAIAYGREREIERLSVRRMSRQHPLPLPLKRQIMTRVSPRLCQSQYCTAPWLASAEVRRSCGTPYPQPQHLLSSEPTQIPALKPRQPSSSRPLTSSNPPPQRLVFPQPAPIPPQSAGSSGCSAVAASDSRLDDLMKRYNADLGPAGQF